MLDLRVFGLLLALAVAVVSWFITCAAWEFDRVSSGWLPLEERSFERLTVVTVGTGGAIENHLRRGPAAAVGLGEALLVVDAGRGVAGGLRQAEIPARQPDAVLLTNLLPENTLGLDDLLVLGWMDGRREPLRLLGPPGTLALARAVEASAAAGVAAWAQALDVDGAPRIEALEVEGGWSGEIGGIALRAAELPGGPTPALAWRAEADGRSAVLSGTGWGADALTDLARGANLLLHQAVLVPSPEEARELGLEEDEARLARERTLYASIEQAGAVARRAGVDALVLVRLRPPPVYELQMTTLVDDHFDGRIYVAEDGDSWTP